MNIFAIDIYKDSLQQTIDSCPFNALNAKTILLTGSTGLIGSYFVDMIYYANMNRKEKIHLIAINHSSANVKTRFSYIADDPYIEFIATGVESIKSINKKIDYIIHAAGLADPVNFAKHPVETITSCVQGTANLLQIAKEQNAKFLFISSREVYGFINDATQYKENDFGLLDFNKIRAAYPEGKRISELLCKSYSDEYGVFSQIARLGYVYGETMTSSDSRAIAQFLNNAKDSKNIVLKSAGTQRRSYTYVGDVISALIHIVVYGDTSVYNVADSAVDISIAELATQIACKAKTSVIFETQSTDEAKGSSDNHDALLNADKLQSLGWKAITPFEIGIARTIQIMRALQ